MIAVKGMKMPKTCSDCDFCHGHICKRTGTDIITNPKGNCPLVDTGKVTSLVNFFLDNMISYINDEWDDKYVAENLSRSEAENYLGHSVKGMSREEIDEEVSEMKRAYYTEGQASTQEILDLFLTMIDA